jgi:hypothetical protein
MKFSNAVSGCENVTGTLVKGCSERSWRVILAFAPEELRQDIG